MCRCRAHRLYPRDRLDRKAPPDHKVPPDRKVSPDRKVPQDRKDFAA
jgi:hypothetical protein